MFYFDWAPVQWDEQLEHRTLRIILPITVSKNEDFWGFAESIDLRTEQYVNSENKIDYFASEEDSGNFYFTIRFHQDNINGVPYGLFATFYPDIKSFNLNELIIYVNVI